MSISTATPDQDLSVDGAPLPSTPIRRLVLLGASGDLANRLLMPALGKLLDVEPQRRDLVLVGAGAEDWDEQTWRDRLEGSLTSGGVSRETVDALLATTSYHRADVTRAEDLAALVAAGEPAPALYFALPPAVTARACEALREVDLPEGTVLVLEKPFGTDAASARALNATLAVLVPEERIFRVDHFLGRSTVLNLLGVRFANRIFEPVWNAEHVASVDIVFDEQLTLEGRAGYYDRAGALVDMIQSHLLQVMALVAMDPIGEVSAFDLREAKAAVLRACRAWGDDPAKASRRARYTTGTIDDRTVPDYVAEPGVDPARGTETLAEVTLEIDSWRWAGVPFRLRSGKAVGALRKEVVVTFKPVPHLPTGLTGECEPDRLRLSMGPDAMALDLNVNGEDDPLGLDHVTLDTDLHPGRLPAYGEVLAGVLDGDPLLAVRGDTAVECWRIVDSVLGAWAADETPMEEYAAGTQGPAGWPL
ncbi:glucose-6-phosphate 1-dehydrogenase [Microlunatus sagamiharensis]|uniref:Glucose-6-phosphate 1-dehydrogenase n=1 Tax=Microlunatus sagamiharensis TaxID=546874 RepID=A0A1H2NFN8_9ACTN|nr:glucose-6-phosphate dehydrogenase [Microlunatus sagamiharensis]SDV04184.1 glucose-6-phosphate 1-dehydrogenase [Microlunatus sagamiharensis]